MDEQLQSEDVIVIKKSVVTNVVVGLVALVVGGSAGFGLGVFAYGQGAASSEAQVAAAPAAPQAQAAAPAAPPARIEDINLDDDPSIGDDDAPVVVVEFSDFECPFCGRFRQETFDQIMEQFGDDILFVYRDFPLSSIHPRAQGAAEASECADEQGAFWEYHDLLFVNQHALDTDSLISYAGQLDLDVEAFTTCVNTEQFRDEVLADFEEGRSYGVSGTPTFFVNGVRLVGAQPFLSFEQVILEELG